MKPTTSVIAKPLKLCRRCMDAWTENWRYSYCPTCLNDWYIEMGWPPKFWNTMPNGETRGSDYLYYTGIMTLLYRLKKNVELS
jgi:hypothetical protein